MQDKKNNLEIKDPATPSSPKGPDNLLPWDPVISFPNKSIEKKCWIDTSIVTNKTKIKIIFENIFLKSFISFKQKRIAKNKK